jgi:hypothetical protein
MWRDLHHTSFAIENDALFLRAEFTPGAIAFAPPRSLAAAPETLIPQILAYCGENNIAPRLCAVSGEFHRKVKLLYPDAKEITDAAWSDYLYNAEDLATLAGRRYSGQRNHINKFRKLYPDWRFEVVNETNLAQTRAFFEEYSKLVVKEDYAAYSEGNAKAIEVIDNFGTYRQFGGILLVGDAIAGAAFGETVGDTLFIHTEKALTTFEGAYPMLVNQFAQMYAGEGSGIQYINREEDDGVEGLRTSKLSYHPCTLLEKFTVELS